MDLSYTLADWISELSDSIVALSYSITGVFGDKDQDCSGTAVTSSEENLERSPCQYIAKQEKEMIPSS